MMKNTHELYDLKPIYESRKSFYGKAKVINTENKKSLYSYDTLVAEINKKDNKATVLNTHSQTTLRHIKEFLKQENFKAENKKQIEADYIN